jgi:hypothetical protein
MKIFFAFLVLACSLALSGCSESKASPTEIARGNLVDKYTLSNGAMIPLADYYCDSTVIKTKDGAEYVKCHAKLKGYTYYLTNFCPAVPKMSCAEESPN